MTRSLGERIRSLASIAEAPGMAEAMKESKVIADTVREIDSGTMYLGIEDEIQAIADEVEALVTASTQPVPSHLSEEAIREKLLGDDAVTALYRHVGLAYHEVVSPEPSPVVVEKLRAALSDVVDASLSASSDTGGAGERASTQGGDASADRSGDGEGSSTRVTGAGVDDGSGSENFDCCSGQGEHESSCDCQFEEVDRVARLLFTLPAGCTPSASQRDEARLAIARHGGAPGGKY